MACKTPSPASANTPRTGANAGAGSERRRVGRPSAAADRHRAGSRGYLQLLRYSDKTRGGLRGTLAQERSAVRKLRA